MKINESKRYIFEFTDVKKDVPHPYLKGSRAAVITYVELSREEFSEPQEDLDGGTSFFNYTFKGFVCKESGHIDKRQKRETLVSFNRTVQTWEFVLELLDEVDGVSMEEQVIDNMRTEVTANLERALEREQEQLKRLLS